MHLSSLKPVLVKVLGAVFLLCLLACSDDEEEFLPNPLPEVDNQFSPKEAWSTSIGSGIDDRYLNLAPVAAYKRVYAADAEGVVQAVELETGKTVWRVDLDVPVGGGPTVAYKRVAIGTKKGELILLDADTGDLVWRQVVNTEVIAAPAIGDGIVAVRGVDGKITAYDLDSGERKWFYDQNVPSLTLRGVSAPLISNGGVVSGFANGKVAVFLVESGQMAWEKRITAPAGRSEIQRLVDIDSKPLLFGSSLYVASYNGNMASMDMRSGEFLWQRELSSFQDMAVDGQLLMVTHDNSHISALDRRNGVILWTQKALYNRFVSAPAAFDRYIVAADFEGYLHWMSRSDGAFVAQNKVDGSGVAAQPLVVDDLLIVYARDGSLVAYKKPSPAN